MLLFVIAPLMFIVASVRQTLVTHFGHHDETGLCALSTWYFSTSIVMETFKLVYKYVETDVVGYKAEPQFAPWPYDYWNTPRHEPTSLWSLVAPFYTPDTGVRTVYSPYGTLSLDGFAPSGPSSAVPPVHALDAGLSIGDWSMGYAPRPIPPRRWSSTAVGRFETAEDVVPAPSDLAASIPSPDAWAFDGPSPTPSPGVTPAHGATVSMSVSDVAPSLLLSSAGSESAVATPAPTCEVAAPSLAQPADHKLAIEPGPVDHRPGRGDGYYARFPQEPESATAAELAEVRDLLVQLKDIQHILDQFGLSPEQLRDYIEAAVAAQDAPVQETSQRVLEGRPDHEASRAQEPRPLNEAEPVVEVHQSVVTSPMVPSPADSRTRPDSYSEASASTWSHEPSGSSMSSDLPAARVSSSPEDVFQGERPPVAGSDDSMDAAGQYPRHLSPTQSSWTGSSPSDEIWGNAKRIELNASPLAHKSTMAGLLLDLPRRPPRIKVRRSGPSVESSASIEELSSMDFEPDTTLSPVPAGRGPVSGFHYSPVLARPSAPEPDTTVEVENSVTVRKREWLDKWHREREARDRC
ncbi:hypothetical protein RhiJN_13548 [Ceratobasidium sp. AG-Ba]|nr:hypothetical protein RhiJN_13548 [Ceratobasidium sp. AG-Ba]QRW14107.1 hypothetical protein RhiLY_13106 [Ceratobasidium sp. AG-Ba]